MGDIDASNQHSSLMRLRVAFVRWCACLGAIVLLMVLGSIFDSGLSVMLAVFLYFAAGLYLNRCVLRNLIDWHPMYNTLQNVTSSKIKYFLFWPIAYFFLFIRLGINRIL